MDSASNQLVTLIRDVAREETQKIDRSVICRVDSVNIDGTVNLYLPSDSTTPLKNIHNNSGYEFTNGDYAVLYKIGNSLNNAFIISKVTSKPIEIPKSVNTVVQPVNMNKGITGKYVKTIGGVDGTILLGENLTIQNKTLNVSGTVESISTAEIEALFA